ncbi:restriction endonuclease subunit S [Escherichia coli]|nr:restriction endonuclease subunit S [Escherichia coli]HAZ3534356.1 restriction endonuclease subunit S [Escherichia coli]
MSAGKLPEGWVETYLSEICSKPQYGYTTKSSPTGNVKFLRTTDITKGTVDWSTVPYCLQNPDDILKYQLQDRDIVISRAGSVGFSFLVKNPPNNVVFASYLIRFKPFDNISELYLKRFLESGNYWVQLVSMSAGNALQNVNAQKLSTLIVPIPPLAEQKIIAEKLDTLLAQVESTKARLEQIPQILKRFRQAVLSAAVTGKLTERWRSEKGIPFNSWEVKKASDICIKVQSGSTPTGNPFAQNGTIPFLKVYNIVNQKIDFDYKPQYITDEVHRSKSKRSIAFPDDVLMNIVGPPLGKVAILTEQYSEWNINQAITLFRVDKERLLSKFLYHVLCEGSLVRDVIHDTKGIVGQINISLTQCREALIPCPSLEEQHEIVRRVEQLFAYTDTIEKQVNNALARVNNLTQSILAKAFRGELTAQWRAENPDLISGENSAGALLEKIKAERAASGGKKASRKKS